MDTTRQYKLHSGKRSKAGYCISAGFACLLAVAMLLAASCTGSGKNGDVHLLRFEQFLFGSDSRATAADFDTPLLNYRPDDPAFMAAVADFTADPVIRDIYHITDSLFHDMGTTEKALGAAMSRAAKLCPEMHYDRFYTLITADFDDYQNRVFCNSHELAISIDRYALPCMGRYQHFGMPAYMVRMSTADHIVPDCMAAIAREHIVLPDGEMTLLDYAIAEGKALYFVDQTLPGTADTLKLRYSKAQLEWMKKNTANVWSWLLQNKLLFSTDPTLFRNLVDDAPKTNAFGDNSAPRTICYIGWQIVKAYMKKSGASMQQLLEETDSQKILNQSGWRP